MKKILISVIITAMVVSCGTSNKLAQNEQVTRGQQYAKMYEEKPVTLLVMPPINNSSNVEAKDLLYTSISKPLAEAGYYVISPLLAMDILKAESAYDAEMFVNGSLSTFHNFFGCDAVVFSEIKTWAKQGFTINTEIRYFIKSAYTGDIIFDRSCDLTLDLHTNSGGGSILGSLVDLAASAINTALTDHIEAARAANYYIFRDIPRGKYNSEYLKEEDHSQENECQVDSFASEVLFLEY